MRLPNLGSCWMIVAAFGFATMGAFVKLAAAKFGNAELVFYRSAIGLALVYAFIFSKKYPLKTPHAGKQLSRAVVGFVSLVLFFYAIAHLPLATAITLNYTSPLFLAIFMPFVLHIEHKNLPNKLALNGAIAIGFIGVILLLKPTLHSNDALAGALGLASGVGAAIAYMHVRQLASLNEPDWRTVFYFTLLSTIASGAWMLVQDFSVLSWRNLPLLTGLGLSATIGQLALTRAYRTGNTLTVASLAYVTVILASLFGAIFWHEKLIVSEWLGIGLIVISGIISVRASVAIRK
jgi:drug/metabolite transporter (DMT)-like permease